LLVRATAPPSMFTAPAGATAEVVILYPSEDGEPVLICINTMSESSRLCLIKRRRQGGSTSTLSAKDVFVTCA